MNDHLTIFFHLSRNCLHNQSSITSAIVSHSRDCPGERPVPGGGDGRLRQRPAPVRCRPARLCGAGRQAVLPDVVHVLDDHDRSRDEQEEGRGRQDLDGRPPERHGGDGEGDEEGNHSVSSPARGGARLVAQPRGGAGYCLLCRSGYDVRHHWTFIWIRVPVLGTVDGPTSAVLFCACSSLVGSECLLIRWCPPLGSLLGQQVCWRLSPAKFSFAYAYIVPERSRS
jgi:hypothetical protein